MPWRHLDPDDFAARLGVDFALGLDKAAGPVGLRPLTLARSARRCPPSRSRDTRRPPNSGVTAKLAESMKPHADQVQDDADPIRLIPRRGFLSA